MEYASMRAFRANPERVWSFYRQRYSMLLEARPNGGHLALAELEQLGFVGAVVTQNIDLLHERAGSREVVEVHGSIRTSSCPRCHAVYGLDDLLALLDTAEAPACRGCGSILKPDVVFFGELLPERAIDRAYELARGAGLMLVVGSSLEVHPVAELPLETLRAGGLLAIVNEGTTTLDERAVVRLEGSAGELLQALVEKLAAE